MASGKTKWGYTAEEWAAAKEQARAELVARAKSRRTVAYSELCDAIAAARFRAYSWALMALLAEACRDEDERHDVVLASLVVRKDEGIPGRGYFEYAARQGGDVSDPRAYWEAELERVYAVYAAADESDAGPR